MNDKQKAQVELVREEYQRIVGEAIAVYISNYKKQDADFRLRIIDRAVSQLLGKDSAGNYLVEVPDPDQTNNLARDILDIAWHGDYSNGNEANGLDEGRVRAAECLESFESRLKDGEANWKKCIPREG